MTANFKEKTKQDYSKIAQLYISGTQKEQPHFGLVDKLIQHLRDKRMLLRNTIDLGSGPGTITNYLAQKGVSRIVAIDITPEFCDFIREKYKHSAPLTYVEVIEDDMVVAIKDILPTSRGQIAAITAGFSIIHIPDSEVDGLLQDIYDLLTPGGMFYLSCYEGKHKGMEIEPAVIAHTTTKKTRERFEVYMNYFTEDELENRLQKVGFRIITSKQHKPDVLPGEIPVAKLEVLAKKPKKAEVYIGTSGR